MPRRPLPGPSRLLVALVALPVAACATAPAPAATPSPSPAGSDAVADLRRDVEAVTAAQTAADEALARALAAARAMDEVVAGLRDPARAAAAQRSWPAARTAVTAAEVDGLRPALIEVAAAVDRARATLGTVRAGYGEETWEQDYLADEDAVLGAVRRYAEATDELVRPLVAHWATYDAVRAETEGFLAHRDHYRTDREAADAYELAVNDHLDALSAAQDDIAAGLARRDEAAETVNAAVRAAAAVWAERPVPGEDVGL